MSGAGEEMENPARDVPWAVVRSGALIVFFYIFATVGILLALPVAESVSSRACPILAVLLSGDCMFFILQAIVFFIYKPGAVDLTYVGAVVGGGSAHSHRWRIPRSWPASPRRLLMSKVLATTPRQDGFRMPAVWEAPCWVLDAVARALRQLARRREAGSARFRGRSPPRLPLCLACSIPDRREMLDPSVRLVEITSNDSCIRDCGPTFVVNDTAT